MSKMNLPGFSVEASLYETSQHYNFAGSVYAAPIGRAVVPELRPIGWTHQDCIDAYDREICQFDDLGDLCLACFDIMIVYPVRAYEIAAQTIFSSFFKSKS